MPAPDPQQATVVAAYGRRSTLRLADGTEVPARLKGRRLATVCGDRVLAEPIDNEPEWLVVEVLPRHNALTRPNLKGRTEVLAANLDALVAVAAAEPRPDWFVVDRYLCAAELMNLSGLVAFNKADDGKAPPDATVELDGYRRVGYTVLVCSATHGHGLGDLATALTGRTAIVAGQSGVGKSSVINAMTDSGQRTADISVARGEGRHTTVASVMVPLAGGGFIVDSPGVRDYAPALESPAEVANGFREIRETSRGCRFADCRHRREPACAVKAAVDAGTIGERRYESYRRLLNLVERQEQKRY